MTTTSPSKKDTLHQTLKEELSTELSTELNNVLESKTTNPDKLKNLFEFLANNLKNLDRNKQILSLLLLTSIMRTPAAHETRIYNEIDSPTNTNKTLYDMMNHLFLQHPWKDNSNGGPNRLEDRNFDVSAPFMILLSAVRLGMQQDIKMAIFGIDPLTANNHPLMQQLDDLTSINQHTTENIEIRFNQFKNVIDVFYNIFENPENNEEFKFMKNILALTKNQIITQEMAVALLSGEVGIKFDKNDTLNFAQLKGKTENRTNLNNIKTFNNYVQNVLVESSTQENKESIKNNIKHAISAHLTKPSHDHTKPKRRTFFEKYFGCVSNLITKKPIQKQPQIQTTQEQEQEHEDHNTPKDKESIPEISAPPNNALAKHIGEGIYIFSNSQ